MAFSSSDKSNRFTQNALSICAIGISLFALVISWLQWNESHKQRLSSITPSVDFMIAEDTDDMPVGISIQNAGPGAARIKSVTWFVDKKPVRDVNQATDFENLENVDFVELDQDSTLAVGEKEWLLKYSHKSSSGQNNKDLDEFMDKLDHHLAVKVSFCDIQGGECDSKCSTDGWCE